MQLAGPPLDDRYRGATSGAWENAAAFQPLRELIERALVTYDWGEAFVVTNSVIKPRIRPTRQPGARRHDSRTANADPILPNIHFSLDEARPLASRVDRGAARHIATTTRPTPGRFGLDREVESAGVRGAGGPRQRHRGGAGAVRPQRGGRPITDEVSRELGGGAGGTDGVSHTNRASVPAGGIVVQAVAVADVLPRGVLAAGVDLDAVCRDDQHCHRASADQRNSFPPFC